MADQHNDIEKYLRGELTPAEMHALEQKALRDPFLAEALEGAEHVGPEHFSLDIAALQQSIHEKSRKRKTKILTLHGWGLYSGIAAGLVLLAVSSYIIMLSIKQREDHNSMIAMNKMTPAEEQLMMIETPYDTAIITYPASGSGKARRDTQPEKRARQQTSRPKAETFALSTQPATKTMGPIAETANVKTVSGDEPLVKRETEKEVLADLSEPPMIVRSSDVYLDSVEVERSKSSSASGVAIQQRSARPAPVKIVRGKVMAAEDEGELPGVNVLIKGTTIGCVTDAGGNYEIALTDPDATLTFSFIGYSSAELRTMGKTELNVRMNADVSALSEVVVVGYSTNDNSDSDSPPVFEMAEPTGGRRSFNKYLEKNVNYPKAALENKIEGKVTVQFTVETNGELTDFRILKALGYGCDEELIRLIKEGPEWIPSKKDDRPVKENVKVRMKFEHPGK
jgi:TonB family protein